MQDSRHKRRRGPLGRRPSGDDPRQRALYALDARQVEGYPRGPKSFTGIERAQFRPAVAQRNPIGLVIRALIRWEGQCLRTSVSRFETKAGVIRETIRAYLAHPFATLEATA